jgi:hypothetical protein
MNETLTPEMQLSIGIATAITVMIIAFIVSRRRGVEVLAHRGFFVLPEASEEEKTAPPAGPHWFVKIFNHTSKPVVITHVGWLKKDGTYVPVVGRALPARVGPGEVIETWISELDMHVTHGRPALARMFQAVDTEGRLHNGRLNRTVPPSGYVA